MQLFIEGPDRCGKGTQIDKIWKTLASKGKNPYWCHYASYGIKDPQECERYSKSQYNNMFHLAALHEQHGISTIHDRAHLGEWVYGKIYRNYDAHFIYYLEQAMREEYPHAFRQSYLITFIDTAENLIVRDDGLSFSTDFSKKCFELERFKEAHELSHFFNKKLINIDGKDADAVWAEVKEFLWP